jgi:hypothetical protein
LAARYSELISILDEVTHVASVSVEKQLVHHLADWIHKVQCAHHRNSPANIAALEKDPLVDWPVYSRLLTVLAYETAGNSFSCHVKLKPGIDPHERELAFTDKDMPSQVKLPAGDR